MAYLRYIDAKRKMEVIGNKHFLGKTTKEISEEMGISEQAVSYYKRKLGLVHPRGPVKNRIPICVVCRLNPVSDSLPHVCTDPDCIAVYLATMQCTNTMEVKYSDGKPAVKADADTKIAVDIQPYLTFSAPKGARPCTLNGVTRLFYSLADHIRFHAYNHYPKGPPRRPPTPLWVNKSELGLHRMLKRDAENASKGLHSESPPPKRMRKAL